MLAVALLMLVPLRDLELEPPIGLNGLWRCGSSVYRVTQRGEWLWVDGPYYYAMGSVRDGHVILFWHPSWLVPAPAVYEVKGDKGDKMTGLWWNSIEAVATGSRGMSTSLERVK